MVLGFIRDRAAEAAGTAPSRSSRPAAWSLNLAGAAVCLLAAAGLFLLHGAVTEPPAGPQASFPAARAALMRGVSDAQHRKVEFAIEMFRLKFGAYPSSLAETAHCGLLRPRDIGYPWRNAYSYARSEKGYALLPPVKYIDAQK